jgi:hypothetical protein
MRVLGIRARNFVSSGASLSHDDLINAGFDMKFLAKGLSKLDIDATGLHINVLEFVAIIMNLWMIIVMSHHHPAPVGGHIFAIFVENTSALSWLHCYASRSHQANICCLA